jgi:hypothetical protein
MSRATGRNWYVVLSVDTLIWQTNRGDGVTHKDIKRQYHRLCLALHPDKNRTEGGGGTGHRGVQREGEKESAVSGRGGPWSPIFGRARVESPSQ